MAMGDELQNSIVAVRGIEVGQVQDDAALTGCTVLLCRKGAVAGRGCTRFRTRYA